MTRSNFIKTALAALATLPFVGRLLAKTEQPVARKTLRYAAWESDPIPLDKLTLEDLQRLMKRMTAVNKFAVDTAKGSEWDFGVEFQLVPQWVWSNGLDKATGSPTYPEGYTPMVQIRAIHAFTAPEGVPFPTYEEGLMKDGPSPIHKL